PKEFIKLLNEVRELMSQEKYIEAMVILENLKSSDKNSESDFNYELVHQLYQLDSNCKSAYHQQRILQVIQNIPVTNNSIKLEDIHKELEFKEEVNITKEILRREVELLILRNLLNCKIEGDQLVFIEH
ncbi:MAG: hypothetical protein ACW98D_08960, partial [Promethearchaeota archaeon]